MAVPYTDFKFWHLQGQHMVSTAQGNSCCVWRVMVSCCQVLQCQRIADTKADRWEGPSSDHISEFTWGFVPFLCCVCKMRTLILVEAFLGTLYCLQSIDQAIIWNVVLKVQVNFFQSEWMVLFLHLNKWIILGTHWRVTPELSGKAETRL